MCLLTHIQVWPIFSELAGTEQCRQLWNQSSWQMANKELWTRTLPAFARQGFPCIASHPGCSVVILISQQCCQDLGRWTLYQSRKTVTSGLNTLLLFLFHVFSWRRKIEQVKNSFQTSSSCVTSLMKAFLKHSFHCADLLNIYLLQNQGFSVDLGKNDGKKAQGMNRNQLQASLSQERAAVYCFSLLCTGYVIPSNSLKAKALCFT